MEAEFDLKNLILRGGVLFDVEGNTPEEVYKNITKSITMPEGISIEQVYKALCDREKILSTAVGNGVALPHARTPIMNSVTDQRVCVAYLKEPLDMKAPDDRPVFVMFVLLTQNSQSHLKILSTLAGLFRSVKFKKALESKADAETLCNIIKEIEDSKKED